MSNEIKRLYRSQDERMFGGVCGGIAIFFGIDPTMVRLVFVLVTFVWPFTPILYLILMLVVPEETGVQAAANASADPESSAEAQGEQ